MIKKFISNNPKICIQYEGIGDLIIFLHGIGGNKNNWDMNIKSLSKKYLCVAWDTRGYGESEDYDGDLKFEDIINDLLHIYKFFDVKKAHIVGLSMGGQIACLFFEKYPKLVRSMILCDTHFGLANLNKTQIQNFINSRKKPLLEGLEPENIALPVTLSLIGNKKNKSAIIQLMNSIKNLHKQSYLKTIDASFKRSHDHVFRMINIPTLIIVGELDKLTPPTMAMKIQKLIKKSELHIIPNAGHLTNIENPKLFNKLIYDFLNKLN